MCNTNAINGTYFSDKQEGNAILYIILMLGMFGY